MPDLTPDVTTTPNFDPGRVAIAFGWLVYDVGAIDDKEGQPA